MIIHDSGFDYEFDVDRLYDLSTMEWITFWERIKFIFKSKHLTGIGLLKTWVLHQFMLFSTCQFWIQIPQKKSWMQI